MHDSLGCLSVEARSMFENETSLGNWVPKWKYGASCFVHFS